MKAADRFERRAKRARYALKANSKGRLRLSVIVPAATSTAR